MAVSPIDGRYAGKVQELQPITSEYGLMHRRFQVMSEWFLYLQSGDVLPDVPAISGGSRKQLRDSIIDFDTDAAARIKEIEATTNHDVKAVEMFLRESVAGNPELARNSELIHLGCTSEDVNNAAYALMYESARDVLTEPDIMYRLEEIARQTAEIPLLSLTHGQPATPTTVGKELYVFADRVAGANKTFRAVNIHAKWNGATGNHAALTFAYPEVDWASVTNRFIIKHLGFTPNKYTTQIEPHDWNAEYMHALVRSNSIKTDLARDVWGYISRGVFAQKVKQGEVGSSTMPHKVNPIDFENAEGNYGGANALAEFIATKLQVSRFQRDLSDSTVLRQSGEVFAHTLIADKSLLRGLGKISVNEHVTAQELDQNWAVLTEAVQTVLRRNGVAGAYDIIKRATRGQDLDRNAYTELVEGLPISDDDKDRLQALTPSQYTGISSQLV